MNWVRGGENDIGMGEVGFPWFPWLSEASNSFGYSAMPSVCLFWAGTRREETCAGYARLSKKFYDTLGEDLATELVDWFNQVDATYRSDLRELNESNFQRFDAKLEQRLAQQDRRIVELDANWEKRIGALKAELIKWMFLFWIGTVGAVLTIMRMAAA
jgi:hypothetical protein